MENFNKKYLIISIIVGIILLVIVLKIFKNYSVDHAKEGYMKLTSVFEYGSDIPTRYTCDGQNVSPELIILSVPSEAQRLILIVDDPDAPGGDFVHWVLYNIPTTALKFSSQELPEGSIQGTNDFMLKEYGGPCPPRGKHRYFFRLYAVDQILDLQPGATKAQVENAMKGHIVEKAELMGLYSRK